MEHAFTTQYFLVDFILDSELATWELHINDNFSVYPFLIFLVAEMNGKMEKTELCAEPETKTKTLYTNISSSKLMQNTTWFGKTSYFLMYNIF